jgi:hypothetical protein
MEERTDDRQLEMLAKIHNQLVDLKQIIVEIELARPGTSHTLQAHLRQVTGNPERIDAGGRSNTPTERQQKVIAPLNADVRPEGGEN